MTIFQNGKNDVSVLKSRRIPGRKASRTRRFGGYGITALPRVRRVMHTRGFVEPCAHVQNRVRDFYFIFFPSLPTPHIHKWSDDEL